MRNLLLILCFSTCYPQVMTAQQAIPGFDQQAREEVLQKIDSLYKLEKNTPFEHRMWRVPSQGTAGSLFITKWISEDKWTTRWFEYDNTGSYYIEKPVRTTGHKRFLKKLNDQRYLTVPEMDPGPQHKWEGTGAVFYYEIFTSKGAGNYYFYCAEREANNYRYRRWFRQNRKIIRIIYNFTGQRPDPC